MKRQFFAFGAGAMGIVLVSFAQPARPPAILEYPAPEIREEQQVVVDGHAETWRLQWAAPPKPVCEASDLALALTCPCMGFAYGESGALALIRLRGGVEIDRLDLAQFFVGESPAGNQVAVLQRRAPDYNEDLDAAGNPGFLSKASKRPVVQVMHFADYEHDGAHSEFYLQTDAIPCGKSVGLVIGVSPKNPRLHAVGSASEPGKPLHLQAREWDALRDASAPIEVLDWACADHGSETETTLRLHWSAAGIDGTIREYTCPAAGEPKRLLHEESLGAGRLAKLVGQSIQAARSSATLPSVDFPGDKKLVTQFPFLSSAYSFHLPS